MQSYYFLTALLQPLEIGKKPPFTWNWLITLLQDHLSASHWHQLGQMRRMIDLDNMILRWKQQEGDPRGFWSAEELDDRLAIHDRAEKPISIWLDHHSLTQDRLERIEELRLNLILHMRKKHNIVGRYYQFLWTIEAASICAREQVFDEEIDPELKSLLASDPLSAPFCAPIETGTVWKEPLGAALREILKESEPLKMHKMLSSWRMEALEAELMSEEREAFFASSKKLTFPRIATYLLQFIEVDRFWHLDSERGLQALPKATKAWLGEA